MSNDPHVQYLPVELEQIVQEIEYNDTAKALSSDCRSDTRRAVIHVKQIAHNAMTKVRQHYEPKMKIALGLTENTLLEFGATQARIMQGDLLTGELADVLNELTIEKESMKLLSVAYLELQQSINAKARRMIELAAQEVQTRGLHPDTRFSLVDRHIVFLPVEPNEQITN
jgi:hypothetical protein